MTKFAMFAAAALMPLALGAQETITMRDGTQFSGRMTSATPTSVVFRDTSGINHRFSVNEIDQLRFNSQYNQSQNYNNNNQQPNYNYNNNGQNYPANNNNQYNGVDNSQSRSYSRRSGNGMTLATGTEISVRTNETIDSSNTNDNRFYSAVVNRDVVGQNGDVVIPRGADAQLVVRRLSSNTMALDLQSVSVNGQRYNVDTANVTTTGAGRDGLGENKRTAEFAGGGALLGTLLGAIAGGGKGAAIGALAGGAAGVGTQVLTRGGQVRVPAESELTFRLDNPMNLRY